MVIAVDSQSPGCPVGVECVLGRIELMKRHYICGEKKCVIYDRPWCQLPCHWP